ncbi:MAG TPA: hypothetical protein VNW99_04025, partial [Cytophagaceae bacterium]|nr:hypothetical protein [Cytophagaceae bacterium]
MLFSILFCKLIYVNNQDFKEFIELLNVHDVECLVVGGYAVGFYGRPRFTGDIGFWIAISKINADKILLVLKEFGFESIGVREDNFLKEDLILQLGYEPYRIDILTSLTGVDFKKCFERKVIADLDGLRINF